MIPITRPAPTAQPPLLPAAGYLRLCAAAHLRAGLLDHFLDGTLLADRTTTLREYCASGPPRALLDGLLALAAADPHFKVEEECL